MAKNNLAPTIIFIFGGSGDLAQRKLMPALYNLYIDEYLPEKFTIIGIGRTKFSNKDYRETMKKGILEFSRRKSVLEEYWPKFSENIEYTSLNVNTDEGFQELGEKINGFKKVWGKDPNLIYYLSVAPQLAPSISTMLHKHKLASNPDKHRMVFEKPFGHDLKSAREL